MNTNEENEPKVESVYLTEEFIYHYWSSYKYISWYVPGNPNRRIISKSWKGIDSPVTI